MKAYTCLTLGGADMDDVEVQYEIERPEPDVNFAGGIVINSLWYNGRDITNLATDSELDEIADGLIYHAGDPDDRGDWEYERRKDYALEQAATARSLAMDPEGRYK